MALVLLSIGNHAKFQILTCGTNCEFTLIVQLYLITFLTNNHINQIKVSFTLYQSHFVQPTSNADSYTEYDYPEIKSDQMFDQMIVILCVYKN